MALANLVVLFLGFFTRLGLASAIVQKPDLTEEDIRAASTTGAVLGTVLFALVWPLTPWICEIFHEPALSGVLEGSGHFSSDHRMVDDQPGASNT